MAKVYTHVITFVLCDIIEIVYAIGVVQEVLVRNGDTVILNCTCTNHSNGVWDGPRKSTSGINDPNNDKLIPYSTGVLLNPKLNLSKYYIIGSYKTRTCNLIIKQFSSYDEGMYHCQFVENNTANSHVYRVFIKSLIEVAINTTHFEDKINLQCHVSDDPGPYTLKDWEHKSESGKHIRYIENAQDGPIVLNKGNYQNSGIYICRVKNGIHDTKGQHHHGNQVVLHYEGPPVFLLNNNKTWFGQCCDEVIITLKVFNSSDITSEPTLKLTEQNDERHLSELIGSLMNSTCRDNLVFYNVSVNVPCIELEFNVKIMKGESRNYSAKLCNKFGCSFFDFTVISTDGKTTILLNDGFKSTFLHDYCWITIGSLVGGILTICVCSHIYCYLKREKTCRRNIIEITLGDNYMYDEVEHLNYNNVIINNVNNDANMNNDNVSSIIENNDIILRVDVNSSDDSSSIKLSGDGYENPYQTFNLCDIDMHHYSSIVSCNYQNTIIFPPTLIADTLDNSNTAADNLKNSWLVIYKKKL